MLRRGRFKKWPTLGILIATMKIYDVVIVGAGIMGASAACELARRGAKVALIDQAFLPNPQGASVDHSKIFRFAYPEPLYVEMAVEALGLWRRLEQETRTHLLVEAGLLMLGNRDDAFEAKAYHTLRSQGLASEMLSAKAVTERFPQFDRQAFSLAAFDPSGGILYADKALAASLDLARRFGVEMFEGERVVTIEPEDGGTLIGSLAGKQWIGRKALLASGPWTRAWLPDFAPLLRTTRQEVVYFEPAGKDKTRFADAQTDFAIGRLPIFIEMDSGFYGFPIHHRGAVKVGNHLKGESLDPYAYDPEVGAGFIEGCREFFARLIPALTDARVVQSHICIYNSSPDDAFIIDWHPNLPGVLIATGFSGHGFKFGPLVGQIVAELLLENKRHRALEAFTLARFQK